MGSSRSMPSKSFLPLKRLCISCINSRTLCESTAASKRAGSMPMGKASTTTERGEGAEMSTGNSARGAGAEVELAVAGAVESVSTERRSAVGSVSTESVTAEREITPRVVMLVRSVEDAQSDTTAAGSDTSDMSDTSNMSDMSDMAGACAVSGSDMPVVSTPGACVTGLIACSGANLGRSSRACSVGVGSAADSAEVMAVNLAAGSVATMLAGSAAGSGVSSV
mmetsp:Transcript_39978/g.98889  ORF Transcript_39978/g.98889 Transcript_39978/m.98889 type:complete len:223 (-) Transcript_39978:1103-1771(-)